MLPAWQDDRRAGRGSRGTASAAQLACRMWLQGIWLLCDVAGASALPDCLLAAAHPALLCSHHLLPERRPSHSLKLPQRSFSESPPLTSLTSPDVHRLYRRAHPALLQEVFQHPWFLEGVNTAVLEFNLRIVEVRRGGCGAVACLQQPLRPCGQVLAGTLHAIARTPAHSQHLSDQMGLRPGSAA